MSESVLGSVLGERVRGACHGALLLLPLPRRTGHAVTAWVAWLQAAAHHVVLVEDVVALLTQDATREEARGEPCRGVGAREPVVALLAVAE